MTWSGQRIKYWAASSQLSFVCLVLRNADILPEALASNQAVRNNALLSAPSNGGRKTTWVLSGLTHTHTLLFQVCIRCFHAFNSKQSAGTHPRTHSRMDERTLLSRVPPWILVWLLPVSVFICPINSNHVKFKLQCFGTFFYFYLTVRWA